MANVNVTWDAVTEDDSGAPITPSQYNVYLNGVLVNFSLTTSYTISGVIPGSHDVTVTAIGPNGESAASNVSTVVVPSGVPAAPVNVVAVVA